MGILLLAAARGTTMTISADGAGRARRRGRAGRSWSNQGLERNRGTPEGDRRLAGRRRRARRWSPSSARRSSGFRSRRIASRASCRRSSARAARRTSSCEQIRRRIAELKGADLAAIFDAQLLMLDDPMLVGRAADDRPRRAGQRRVGGAARARRDRRGLRRRRGSVPARAQGRPARRRRPPAHEPARRKGRRARSAAGSRHAVRARSPTS